MKKLSILLIAALLTIFAIGRIKTTKAQVEFSYEVSCGCQSPSPSPTPTSSPIPTPSITPSASPTPTPTSPNCPDDYHLDASGQKCVQFELGGAPPPPPVSPNQVLGTQTTLASTGANVDQRLLVAIICSIFVFLCPSKTRSSGLFSRSISD
jgi:hypothetical protein